MTMKITRIRIRLQPSKDLDSGEHFDHPLGCDDASPAPPEDENNYWAEAIEDGDKFHYRVDDTTLEITADQFRRVIDNPTLYYFSTALKLHLEIKRVKKQQQPGDKPAIDQGSNGELGPASPACPFCGKQDWICTHWLGSRDLHFCEGFTVLDGGSLPELGELFWELGERVTDFLGAGADKARVAALKPRRLRDLVQAAADGDNNRAFTAYVEQVGKDTRIAVKTTSRDEDSGGMPGFSSIVKEYWAEDVPFALAGMRLRIGQDIRRLQRVQLLCRGQG
jgi:hypothetical protein